MNSFIRRIGGKKALRKTIIDRFPLHYDRYVEAFGGAGWVLFYKPVDNRMEVFNDYSRDLINLYRCARDCTKELINEVKYELNSRYEFEARKKALKTQADLPDVKRAAYYFLNNRQSYCGGGESFAGRPVNLSSEEIEKKLYEVRDRLANVVIENQDFEAVIRHYDQPNCLFYCDPPYSETESMYPDGGFTREDHLRLASCLSGIQGKFLLSYNDCTQIRGLYDNPKYWIESVERPHNMAQRYRPGEMYKEVLISNYDTEEARNAVMQLSIFDTFGLNDTDYEEDEE